MSKGLVYILTNPCLNGWIKIGMTERNDIESRLAELNAPPNIPLSYRCYAVYETENPRAVEQRIHNIIDTIDDSLHAREQLPNGRIREREFFKISAERAYSIFVDVAALRGEENNLKYITPTLDQIQEQEFSENNNKGKNSTFDLFDVNIGDKITFLPDKNIVAEVLDNKNKVKFNNKKYTVTALAQKILKEKGKYNKNINGWRYFSKDGRVALFDLRNLTDNQDNI